MSARIAGIRPASGWAAVRSARSGLIRRRQLEISEFEQGLDLAKEWVVTKVTNQAEFLDRLSRPREDKAEKLKASSNSLKELSRKLGALSGTVGWAMRNPVPSSI